LISPSDSASQEPEALEQQALEAYRNGQIEQALAGFEAARQAFAGRGDRAKAAEMANDLCVAFLKAGRASEALAAVSETPETFLALGDAQRAAQAHGNLGSALEACGNLAEAEAAYRQACDRFAALGDRESEALTWRALSQVQLRLGRPMEAIATMQSSLKARPRATRTERLLRRILDLPLRLLGK